jgi:hypothetical protein
MRMGYVQGRGCSIVIKTEYRELGIPYAIETIRETETLLTEEAAIEGDGSSRAIRKSGQQVGRGVTGCVVTPLTIGTAPLLWAVVLGKQDAPVFVSETRNLYKHVSHLAPYEDCPGFGLIRQRGDERIWFENCGVEGFELRIKREAGLPGVLHLRLDVRGDCPPEPYLVETGRETGYGERFKEAGVRYRINGVENTAIYGLKISVTKTGGTKAVVHIRRIMRDGEEFPPVIESLSIKARLFRDHYEWRQPGVFRLSLSRLVLAADETGIESADTVIGSLRYYVTGTMTAETFSTREQ